MNSEIVEESSSNYSEVTVTMDEVADLEKWIDSICAVLKTIGIFECFTILGALIGIPLLWASSSLKAAKNSIANYASTGNTISLKDSLSSIKSFFVVMILISLVYFAIIACVILGLYFFIS